MLQAGPRSTFRLPSRPEPGARDAARQILKSIRNELLSQREVRIGAISTGCDGRPLINPLDGTECNGSDVSAVAADCGLVLFNTHTRTVMTDSVGRAFAGAGAACIPMARAVVAAPISAASLRTRRRFLDNLGNIYGPTGTWLSSGNPPAQLETDYVHRIETSRCNWDYNDVHHLNIRYYKIALDKTIGVPDTETLSETYLTPIGRMQGGHNWPTIYDAGSRVLLPNDTNFLDNPVTSYEFYGPQGEVEWSGTYVGASDTCRFFVSIKGGDPTKFNWSALNDASGLLASASDVVITHTDQELAFGISVKINNGGASPNSWRAAVHPNNRIVRYGVAVRGTITADRIGMPGVSATTENDHILMTTEAKSDMDTPGVEFQSGSHALVVRDPDTLDLRYRKTLDGDSTTYSWFLTGQKFCFSTNDEGLFFMHCYTNPALTGPPSPYPGHEFGSPNPRKLVAISVDPISFEPTITETITLEDNAYTVGSTFAVAI